jgi:hypothetical protein
MKTVKLGKFRDLHEAGWSYFLNKLSKAVRASLGERGAGALD